MPFGLWAQNGPRNRELDRVPVPNEKGQKVAHCEV